MRIPVRAAVKPVAFLTERVTIELEEDDVRRYTFTDGPLNRAAIAIRQEFGADPEMFMSIMARLMALYEIVRHDELQRWIRPDVDDPRHQELNSAVIKAAAIQPLDEMKFEVEGFVRRVEEIEASEPDEDD